jgi:hypothetical protein
MFGARRKPESQSEDEMLMDALGDLATRQDKAGRARRRLGRHLLPAWLEGRVVVGILILVAVVVEEGVRREDREFYATVTSAIGQVMVQDSPSAAGAPPQANQQLADNAVVTTGPQSTATLEFPDGSVTTLDQNTVYGVRLLEYSRGGAWRGRSFTLAAGRVWSTVGPYFGRNSRMRIYTPSAVASVRGTRYAVSVDPGTQITTVQTNEGYVTTEGFTGQALWVGQGGQSSVGYGQVPAQPGWMTADATAAFGQPALSKPIRPRSWVDTALLAVTQTLDGPLTILGIGKCSWGVGSADFARRTAAMEGLRYIMQFMEGHERYPEFVNPATLRELSIPDRDAQRILKSFDGAALLRFMPAEGGRSYRILVRARDRKRTLFVLEPTGITTVKPDDEGAYLPAE